MCEKGTRDVSYTHCLMSHTRKGKKDSRIPAILFIPSQFIRFEPFYLFPATLIIPSRFIYTTPLFTKFSASTFFRQIYLL